jgi:hypothetical protein
LEIAKVLEALSKGAATTAPAATETDFKNFLRLTLFLFRLDISIPPQLFSNIQLLSTLDGAVNTLGYCVVSIFPGFDILHVGLHIRKILNVRHTTIDHHLLLFLALRMSHITSGPASITGYRTNQLRTKFAKITILLV